MTRIRVLFLLNGAAIAVFAPYVSVVLAERGFDAAAIGFLVALTSLGYLLALPVWGHLADTVFGRARALRYAILIGAGLMALFWLPLPPVVVGLAYVGYATCFGATLPLSDALAVNALADPARDYGRIRVLASASFTVVTVALGVVYGVTGYEPAAVLFVAAAVAIALLTRGMPDLGLARLAAGRRGGAMREALAVEPRLAAILVAVGLAHVGMYAGFTFLSLRIVELGGGAPEVGLSSAVAAAAEIGAMLLAARLIRRIGLRSVFAGSAALYAVALVAWAVLTSPAAIIASRVVSGVAYSGLFIASVMAIQMLLPARLQGSGQSLVALTTAGLASFVANVAGGPLYAGAGPAVVFAASAGVAGLGALAGWLTLPRRGAQPVARGDAGDAGVPQPTRERGGEAVVEDPPDPAAGLPPEPVGEPAGPAAR